MLCMHCPSSCSCHPCFSQDHMLPGIEIWRSGSLVPLVILVQYTSTIWKNVRKDQSKLLVDLPHVKAPPSSST
eukprot:scaffold98_cov248-Ochromonas_danica.AAC.21